MDNQEIYSCNKPWTYFIFVGQARKKILSKFWTLGGWSRTMDEWSFHGLSDGMHPDRWTWYVCFIIYTKESLILLFLVHLNSKLNLALIILTVAPFSQNCKFKIYELYTICSVSVALTYMHFTENVFSVRKQNERIKFLSFYTQANYQHIWSVLWQWLWKVKIWPWYLTAPNMATVSIAFQVGQRR
jgi:hypothetical protein